MGKGVTRWIRRSDGVVQRYRIKQLKRFERKYRKTQERSRTGAIIWERKERKGKYNDYKIAVYTYEDTDTGTSVKLELFIESWKTKLKEKDIEGLLDELEAILIREVGESGNHFKASIGFLEKKKTNRVKDEVKYTATVLNINPMAEQKNISSMEGVFYESEICS